MNFKNLITSICLIICFGFILVSCKPESLKPEGLASFSVTNAAPGSPTVDVLVDGRITSAGRLAYGSTTVSVPGATTIYLPIRSGNGNVVLSKDTGKTASIVEASGNFEQGKSYSYFIYDTLLNGKAKLIRLNDDLSVPSTGNVKVRFLNLAPKAAAFDVTFLRITAYDDTTVVRPGGVRTYESMDSFTISNKPFIGATPDVNALSAFSSIPGSTGAAIVRALGFANVPAANRNNRYIIKVKNAGTQTVVKQLNEVNLTSGRIFTVYTSGTAMAQPLNLSVVTNY